MAQIETLGILQDIESLVSDRLQVSTLSSTLTPLHPKMKESFGTAYVLATSLLGQVSYKWLSRNYLLSSNSAKRLLQEFVEKHGNGFEVVYALSGWLKGDSPSYHIRLVTGTKLEEAKQEFDGSCSVQVYSVQACIPKDPAVLWNVEFVQAEELFKQPSTIDNCLRDNRYRVYSVQACIPKDPAVLWNVEFVQAEELFKQPSTIDNCLRDNRVRAGRQQRRFRGREGIEGDVWLVEDPSRRRRGNDNGFEGQ
ncbi:DNA polymerase delta subunit 3 [Morus notabilis]|uniref:DNA polymerase delta subunit 3 n=1 Tax=Morus notabilis TaxID=981085 RepID=W9S2I9_9ROSA|nr:DNA polymerase delta subunit 3 [Morus notabilis]